jgi:hypothetical protein
MKTQSLGLKLSANFKSEGFWIGAGVGNEAGAQRIVGLPGSVDIDLLGCTP